MGWNHQPVNDFGNLKGSVLSEARVDHFNVPRLNFRNGPPPVSESLSNDRTDGLVNPLPQSFRKHTYPESSKTSSEVAKVKIKGPVGFAWRNFPEKWPWRMGLHLGSGCLGPRNQLELEYNQGIPQLRGMVPKHVRSKPLAKRAVIKTLFVWSCLLYV